MPVLTPEEYKKRASQIYDPSYAVKIANENTAFNNTMANYGNQGNMIQSNFDKSVQTTDRNTALNQNQFNNNTLGRGLARSSVATTGLAGIANTGTRVKGELEADKNQQISNLETLKTNLRSSLDSTLNAMSSEHEGGINSMALQLQQRDEDIQRQSDAAAAEQQRYEQDFAFKQQQAAADEAYRYAALRKSSGSGSNAANEKKLKDQMLKNTWSVFYDQLANSNSSTWLEQNRGAIVQNFGDQVYKDMRDEAWGNNGVELKKNAAKNYNMAPADY